MHDYTKDAITKAGARCETQLQLAHIHGVHDRFVRSYFIEKAEEFSAHAFQLAENDARARAESCIPTGDHWS